MNREKKNILIIDDDVDIGNAVEEMLKRKAILFPEPILERKHS